MDRIFKLALTLWIGFTAVACQKRFLVPKKNGMQMDFSEPIIPQVEPNSEAVSLILDHWIRKELNHKKFPITLKSILLKFNSPLFWGWRCGHNLPVGNYCWSCHSSASGAMHTLSLCKHYKLQRRLKLNSDGLYNFYSLGNGLFSDRPITNVFYVWDIQKKSSKKPFKIKRKNALPQCGIPLQGKAFGVLWNDFNYGVERQVFEKFSTNGYRLGYPVVLNLMAVSTMFATPENEVVFIGREHFQVLNVANNHLRHLTTYKMGFFTRLLCLGNDQVIYNNCTNLDLKVRNYKSPFDSLEENSLGFHKYFPLGMFPDKKVLCCNQSGEGDELYLFDCSGDPYKVITTNGQVKSQRCGAVISKNLAVTGDLEGGIHLYQVEEKKISLLHSTAASTSAIINLWVESNGDIVTCDEKKHLSVVGLSQFI